MDFYSMLLAKKLKKESSGDVTIESLVVTENGNYSETGKAYSPVIVNVPLPENGYLLESASGQVVNITDAAPLYLQECSAEIIAVQEGSGTPSPENIRPISGRSEVAIDRVGKNWLNYSSDNVGWASDKTAIVDVLNSLPEGTYTLTVPFTLTSISGDITNAKCQVRIDVNFAPVSVDSKTWGSATIGTTKTITCQIVVDSSVKGKFTNCYLYGCGIDGVDARGTASVSNVQLELGNTATTYEPYQGKTYTIQLGDTIYGGELDVVTGRLTVTHGEVDLGNLNWMYDPTSWIGANFYAELNNIKYIGDYATTTYPILCEKYKVVARNLDSFVDDSITVDGSVGQPTHIQVKDSTYTDAIAFKTAVTGTKLVYELATPYTIQLTPQQIRLLEGTNNLSCNAGELNIEYFGKGVN